MLEIVVLRTLGHPQLWPEKPPFLSAFLGEILRRGFVTVGFGLNNHATCPAG